MTDNKVCPSCGATLDSNVGSQCPFCGSALSSTPDSGSAKTMISSRPLNKQGEFDNSAEAVDEIKRLVREGEAAQAAKVASEQFDLKPEDAKNTVDQVAVDMKYSGGETMLADRATPPPPPHVTAQPSYSVPPAAPASFSTPPISGSVVEPAKPSRRNWIIGGSIGAVVFLCLCCCLPLLIYGVNVMRSR